MESFTKKAALPLVEAIQNDLKDLHGVGHLPSACDYLVISENRDALVIKEDVEEAEAAIFLRKEVLERLENKKFPEDFHFELLPDLSVVIEELSHFNLFCQRTLASQSLSPLELEVQAEVDKFATALEWLARRNEEQMKDQLFEVLFGQLELGDWVPTRDRERYEEAHQIARSFCRKILHQESSREVWRKEFRKFFHRSPSHKLNPTF